MKHSPGFLALVNEAKKNIRECSVREVKDRFDRGERIPPDLDRMAKTDPAHADMPDGGINRRQK